MAKSKKQDWEIIDTPYGQWEYPGSVTRIPSNEITMQGVPYPVLGISNTGDMQYMEPGGEYSYDGSSVTEYPLPEAGGGYRVIRSNERKGKTHKVIGPDGTVKFFGDSKLGQHPKDKKRKKAFYARHKKNLAKNPYFRAFARKTWADGGELDFAENGILAKFKENLGNLNTREGYNTPIKEILKTGINKSTYNHDFSNKPMSKIAREQDAFRIYLDTPTKTGSFEKTGENKYRIRDYQNLFPDTMPSDADIKKYGAPEYSRTWKEGNPLKPYNDFVMGRHTITKGKDDKGEYLQYRDVWNLDPSKHANNWIDQNVNPTIGNYLKKVTPVLDKFENIIFNPFELTDKIYYDPVTKLRADKNPKYQQKAPLPGQSVQTMDYAQGGMLPDLAAMAAGGQFLTVGGEYHRIYKNADGDIMVNHPKEDKGKWDTINLTDKAGAKTVADGVAATKKWHRENPYAFGGLPKAQEGFRSINDNPLVQAAKIFDPTGVSSYPDVYYSGVDFANSPSWSGAADLGINVFGALPMIGKLAMPAKLARAAAKTTNKATGVSKGVNAVIDTAPELIPFLRRPTEIVQDFTSKKFVQPFANAIKGGGKTYKAEKINTINSNVDRINLLNNLSDLYSTFTSGNSDKKKAFGGNLILEKYQGGGSKRKKKKQTIAETPTVDMYGRPIESRVITKPDLERSYYDPRRDAIFMQKDYNQLDPYDKEKMLAHENYHAYQFKNDRSTYLPVRDIPYQRPPMVATDEYYYDYHNRKPIESQIDIDRFKEKNPSFRFVSDDAIFNYIVDPEQYLNPETLEGEAKFYEDLGVEVDNPAFAKKLGGSIKKANKKTDWEIIPDTEWEII